MQRIEQAFAKAPDAVQQLVNDTLSEVRSDLLGQFLEEPPESVPGDKRGWQPQERRAYFAKMRALGLQPPYKYERTHRVSQGWTVYAIFEPMGPGYIYLANGATDEFGKRYRGYVTGRRQRPYHQDTGWQKDAPKIRAARNLLIQRLTERLDRLGPMLSGEVKNA